MSKVIIIFSTAKSLEEARRIGHVLVEEGHVACCNIVQSVESIFKWQGKLCAEHEVLMILKTKDDKFDIVEKRIRQIHSYEVPEIIAIPLSHGSKNYLDWVVQETGIS
ncbi:MAG: divalent-cation tolerance protein CutA [Candidatus Jettenia sp. CY-1]|nr:MAG: divalent-cation tolerance protein CutA [Candidatus Jettenia sp.]WKZ20003.1 MAG: divalent-cation tolerance protein CutA [Candidatus Jettenia sp. CY-1]